MPDKVNYVTAIWFIAVVKQKDHLQNLLEN